jgi:hypothetical protein
MRIIFGALLSLVCAVYPCQLMAQETPLAPAVVSDVVSDVAQENIVQVTPQPNFAERLVKDQRDLWASPFKIKRGDVKWLVPLGAGAAVLFTKDWDLSQSARSADGIRPASRFLSNLGGGGPLAIASGTLWGVGKVTHNSKAAKTGQMAAEAVFHTELVTRGLKTMFNRERPSKIDGQGQFWGGGRSFPSGHAATTFAFATVVADQYKNKPLIAIGAYGLATAVSMSRVGGLNHFPSDVLIGATVGHLIGRFILHRHKE